MSNRSDISLAGLPPVTPCPSWCIEKFPPWNPDRAEYMREHRRSVSSGDAAAVSLYAVDYRPESPRSAAWVS